MPNGPTATAAPAEEDAAPSGGDRGGGGGPPAPVRRSSVVVIPPMQVCPGDLLVYSKALTHRSNFNGKLLAYLSFR